MAIIETKCPSGLLARVRGLKGEQINQFANRTNAEARRIGYELLGSCVEVLDPGPAYPGLDVSKPDWTKTLVADRFWLYLQMRVASYGDNYVFSTQCTAPSCRHKFEWGFRISDLPFKPLAEASIATFVAGNNFGDIRLADADLQIRLATGEVETEGERLQGLAPDKAHTIGISNRITSVNGQTGRGAVHSWVLGLDMLDVLDLVDRLDEHDGGVETQIDIYCPKCKAEYAIELPLERDFWTPDKRKRSLVPKVDATDKGGGVIHPTSDF
jgi:hypothetical protein